LELTLLAELLVPGSY